jgi:tungstate transport system substrate-binding protein
MKLIVVLLTQTFITKENKEMKAVKMVFAAALILGLTAMPGLSETQVLMMATTTSTDNTGLLDYLAPLFKADTGIELKWTGTGTGKALKLGENCDVDVLVVHAPAAEKTYVESGFGVDRREIMYNDFIIIGPESDPAQIKDKTIKDALGAVKEKQAVFVSRGDNSGTHQKELEIWAAVQAQVPEKETWYVQTGQGMLATINVANERGGYTLTDRGTYIKYESNAGGNPPLKILVQGDDVLKNQYSVIAVAPQKCPHAKYELVKKFSDWITGEKGQKLIAGFKLLDKALFVPNAK